MSSKPWYHKGLKFACTQCGNCCRNHGDYTYVYLSPREVSAIARHLGMARRAFLEAYCKAEDGWVTLRMDAPACPFLSEENRCRIYPVRPAQCAAWPFWKENLDRATWEEIQRDCPGIGQGELHSRAEIERTARSADD